MANHTIALSTMEESVYQVYLTKTSQTDAVLMGKLKDTLVAQVIIYIQNNTPTVRLGINSETVKLFLTFKQ
jgi:hypothetical protein